jgi:hypothetical protein
MDKPPCSPLERECAFEKDVKDSDVGKSFEPDTTDDKSKIENTISSRVVAGSRTPSTIAHWHASPENIAGEIQALESHILPDRLTVRRSSVVFCMSGGLCV